MNAKAKGTRNEHRSARLLEAAGYAVTRAAASPGAAEMETLRSFRCPRNCRRLIHRWRDGQRMPDVREL